MPLPTSETKLPDTEALQAECDALEEELQELRVRYEKYFLGMERQCPTPQHTALKRRVAKLKGGFVRGTALKFKVQSLHAKYLTYERLWERTLKEMEEGTYRRDLFKARLHQKEREAKSQKKEARPLPAVAPVASPAAPAPGGLTDARARAVYDAYVAAKRQCNEDVSKLTFETVSASLRRQVPDLLKKHNAKEVEFKVVVKDGKAALRAIPK